MSIEYIYSEGWLLDDDAVLSEIPKLREHLVEIVPEPEDCGEKCLFSDIDQTFKPWNELVPSLQLADGLRQLTKRFREKSEHLQNLNYFPDPTERKPRYFFSEDGVCMRILCGIRTRNDKPLVAAKTVLDLLDNLIQQCEKNLTSSITALPVPTPPKIDAPSPKYGRFAIAIVIGAVIAAIIGIVAWKFLLR